METNFFSGSENLYKYLVSIGILLTILTVYYPLKEKQELEILTIGLEKDVEALKYKIDRNYKNVNNLKSCITENGKSTENKEILLEVDKLNNENHLSQIESEKKYSEIKVRRKHIRVYNTMFWIFFPIGSCLMGFGFYKWYSAKKDDDKKLKLENQKLEMEINKLSNKK